MTLGFRGRLFVVSLALVSTVALVSGLVLESRLREWLGARTDAELLRQARSARVAVDTALRAGSLELDDLADRIGEAVGARVTLIAADGTVIGDSLIAKADLSGLESHDDRPEVLDALAVGVGYATRFSTTTGMQMRYAAVVLDGAQGRTTVRLAQPALELTAMFASLHAIIVIAAIIGLLVAVAMSALASELSSRTLRTLARRTRSLTRGATVRGDEVGRVAGSLKLLAEDLDRSVEDLATARDQLQTVLEGLTEAVVAIDGSRRITVANPAAHDLLEIAGDPRGKPLSDVVYDEPLHELVERLVSNDVREPDSTEMALLGSGRRILVRAAPLRTSGVVLAMLDVTEMRHLERVRRDFVANVSHELRTPVSVIRANAETLLDGGLGDPERSHDFVEAIERNAERLSRMVTDLLDLSRIEAGQLPLAPRDLELAMVVDRAAAGLRALLEKKGHHLDTSGVGAERAFADADALEQILVNLLDNAVRYTPAGGKIRVAAQQRGDHVRVEVCDDGPGIPAKYRARIFERFYRVDKGRSREQGGTGLGLAIVKHLVESMGGEVGVEPALTSGAVFWFTAPAPPPCV